MKHYLTILLLFCVYPFLIQPLAAQSDQHQISGTVVSEEGPLPFATLGIVQKGLGTISDENGKFLINIPESLINDVLTVSYVGYEKQELAIGSLIENSPATIQLKEQVHTLDDVVVSAKRKTGRIQVLGGRKSQDVFVWINDGGIGSEVTRLMKPKGDFLLERVSTQIQNMEGTPFTLLVNIYQQDPKTKKPGKQLLREIKVIKSTQREGWLEVDLSDQELIITGPFFVSFQWTNVENKIPLIGADTGSGEAYVRTSPLGKWKEYMKWNINAKGRVVKNL